MLVRSAPYLVVNAFERRVRIGAFAQQHDAFDDVVVIDDFAVRAMNGFADSPEADLRALRHLAISLTRSGGAVLAS